MNIVEAADRFPTEQSLHALLQPTPLLDYEHSAIRMLLDKKKWRDLNLNERIGGVYDFVRDDIAFGYNASDDLPASAVLKDGIGQCNTKGTLLMALLRAVGVPCRFHGFTINKTLQKGAITGLAYLLAPRSIIHSWVEVWYGERWVQLEGFILDRRYLTALQRRFAQHRGPFCGYGVATPDLKSPPIEWCGNDTYIQRDGINHDYGLFDTPDAFYAKHGVNASGWKKLLYQNVVRHWMNRNVTIIRASD